MAQLRHQGSLTEPLETSRLKGRRQALPELRTASRTCACQVARALARIRAQQDTALQLERSLQEILARGSVCGRLACGFPHDEICLVIVGRSCAKFVGEKSLRRWRSGGRRFRHRPGRGRSKIAKRSMMGRARKKSASWVGVRAPTRRPALLPVFRNYIIQDHPPPSLGQRPIARGLQASPRYRWTRYRTLFAPHTHRQHHPFTSTPPQLRMVQRGPRPPHAQRIPRITRTQSPPRGRMCSVVPLALCARATPVVPVPHPSRFSKHTRSMHFSHAVQGRLRPGSTRVVPSSQLFCTSSLWRCRHTQE